MKALVINLQSATERMSAMAHQLRGLGLDFDRIEATNSDQAAMTLTAEYWQSWERPLKDTEKACLLSHIEAWEKVIAAHQPMLILEDDAVLSKHVPQLLEALRGRVDIDHLTLETRDRRKLLAHKAEPVTETLALRRLLQDRSGAAAYLLWPSGAQKLIAHTKRRAGLADAVICQAYDMASYQVEPACAVQQDRCALYGIATDYEPRSAIDAGQAAKEKKSLRFRLRRASAQLRMGLRQLAFAGRAEQRKVALNPADFVK